MRMLLNGISRMHLTARRLLPAMLVAIILLCCWSLPAAAQSRQKISINDSWRFSLGKHEDARAATYDDQSWTRISLPHTWNAEDAFIKERSYFRGTGWYRKSLTIPESFRGRQLFLYFEGVNQVAEVFLNGRELGRHIGGYSAIVFDISAHVEVGESNVLAVRVDNSHNPDIPPLNADFTFYGGIYRDVWLVATDPIHIDMLDYASPGVYISTPGVSAASSRVSVRGTVVNDSNEDRNVLLRHRIVDGDGREIRRLEQGLVLPAKRSLPFGQTSQEIPAPKLWSPSSPYLYQVHTEVVADDSLLDALTNPLGFRWFSVDGQKGFMLNGKPMKLYGTNRHQDWPGYGSALPNWAHRRDLEIIKNDGFNFLRLAHYPQDPVVLAEADRLGLLIWEETPLVNLITTTPAFAENCENMLLEMIRQHYNHPSIAMWGYMNEIMLRRPESLPKNYYKKLLALSQRLEELTREEDPGRLTVTAQSNEEVYNGKGVSDLPDILGMNLYFGWYYHDFAGLGDFLDELNRKHPDRPLLVSEYGAGSDDRVHTADPKRFDFSTQYQQRFHEENFREILERDYMVGSAIWNQFDFGSGHRQDTRNAINQKGIYYFDRTPKDIAWFYRAHLLDTPILHIAVRDHDLRAGSRTDDASQQVAVYSNLKSVELFLNDENLGSKELENATARWDVQLKPGENLFRASGMAQNGLIEDQWPVVYEARDGFFLDAQSPVREIAINFGAHYHHTDASDLIWEAEQAYLTADRGTTQGEARRTHHRIYGSDEDPLFQSARIGATDFRFVLPDGRYQIELGFAEIENVTSGERVFDVSVNGTVVFQNLDLTKQAGRYGALVRNMILTAVDGSGIHLELKPRTGQPLLNMCRIERL